MRRAPILALGVSLGVHALVLMAVLWLPRPTPLAVTKSPDVSRAPSIVGFEVVARPGAPSFPQDRPSAEGAVRAPVAPVVPSEALKRADYRLAPRRMKSPPKTAPEAPAQLSRPRPVAPAPSPERASEAPQKSEAAVARDEVAVDVAAANVAVIDTPSSEAVAAKASEEAVASGAPDAVQSDASAHGLAAATSMNAASSATLAPAGPGASSAAGTSSGQGNGQGIGDEDLRAISDRLAEAASPCYPRAAQRRGHEGVAQMRFCLDETGAPHEIALVHSSGRPQLDAAARCAIERAAPFPPLPGQCLTVPIRFALRRR